MYSFDILSHLTLFLLAISFEHFCSLGLSHFCHSHSGNTSCIMGRREDKRRREKINKIVTKFSWETSYIARQWSVSRIEKTNMKFFQRSERFSETLILSMKLCFEEGKAKKSWLFCFESTQACVLRAQLRVGIFSWDEHLDLDKRKSSIIQKTRNMILFFKVEDFTKHESSNDSIRILEHYLNHI